MSGNIPPNATFVGSTECLDCHGDNEDMTKTAHKLGISVVDAARRHETRAARIAQIVGDAAAGKRP